MRHLKNYKDKIGLTTIGRILDAGSKGGGKFIVIYLAKYQLITKIKPCTFSKKAPQKHQLSTTKVALWHHKRYQYGTT
jgi:hypothetical protein